MQASLISINTSIMNLKRIFGLILTIAGIGGLVYAAVVFAATSGGERDMRALVIYGVLGLIFVITGIGLVKNTKDEA
jgi:hypothetical protein